MCGQSSVEPAGLPGFTPGAACPVHDSVVSVVGWGRLGMYTLTAASVVVLTGCSPYPDGVVARRADGYVVRSECPPGSSPHVAGVRVSVLIGDPQGPSGTAEPTFAVDEQVVWAAHVKDGGATQEIVLFQPAEDLVITTDRSATVEPGTWTQVEIFASGAVGGTRFRWDEMQVGEASVGGEIMPEADIPAPGWNTGVNCHG